MLCKYGLEIGTVPKNLEIASHVDANHSSHSVLLSVPTGFIACVIEAVLRQRYDATDPLLLQVEVAKRVMKSSERAVCQALYTLLVGQNV